MATKTKLQLENEIRDLKKKVTEIESYKKKIVEKVEEHIDANSLDLCDSGLRAFFNDIDVNWDGRLCNWNLYFSVNLYDVPLKKDGTEYYSGPLDTDQYEDVIHTAVKDALAKHFPGVNFDTDLADSEEV